MVNLMKSVWIGKRGAVPKEAMGCPSPSSSTVQSLGCRCRRCLATWGTSKFGSWVWCFMELGVLLPGGGRWGKGRGQDSAGQLPQAFSCPRTATSSFPSPPPPPPPPPLPPSGGLQLTDCHCVWRVDTGAGGAEEGEQTKKWTRSAWWCW